MNFELIRYSEEYEGAWDRFVIQSRNGTFLQSRHFLNYHPKERFRDHSLMIVQGTNICAVIPGCEYVENGKKIFYSHKGSTFGGIIIADHLYNVIDVQNIIRLLLDYLKNNNFNTVCLKQTPNIFCKKNADLIDYLLFNESFKDNYELNYSVDLNNINKDIVTSFNQQKRRYYNKSSTKGLTFKELKSNAEIELFYMVLCKNLKKFDKKPVHTIDELIELYTSRIPQIISFYGVYLGNTMIAGSMVFKFERVFHTQYLASDNDFADYYPAYYLYYNLIKAAIDLKYDYLTFGIVTENCGKTLNLGLATFKEGFGTEPFINKSFFRDI